MFARVTMFESDPSKADENVRYYRETVVPQAQDIDGFRGAMALVDRAGGTTLTVTFWHDDVSMKASEDQGARLRAQAATDLGFGTPTVERYEVAYAELQV